VRKHVVSRCGRGRGDGSVADAAAWRGRVRRRLARRPRRPEPRNTAAAGAIKRLPDGTPDIRGNWVRVGGNLNEANPPNSELKAFGVLSEPQGFGQGQVAWSRGEVAEAR
jgi:hypothetical protein